MPRNDGEHYEYFVAILASNGHMARILGVGPHTRRRSLLAELQRPVALGALLPDRVERVRIHYSRMTSATNRTEPLGFRTTRALNDAFREIYASRGISMSEALNDALMDWIEKYGGKEIT